MLLELGDVNPHTADENGRTLISWALEGGCLELEMLLQRNILTRLEEYRAEHFSPGLPGVGMGGIVRILLERNGVNPYKPDNHDRTPAEWASQNRYFTVANMLPEWADLVH